MAMAHQPLVAVFGVLVGMAAEEGCDLGLDSLRQQGSRALAQNFGQRVGELCWLNQLGNIILGHGVSLLWWRSGGSNTPTIRRLNPSRRRQLPRIPRAGTAAGAICSFVEAGWVLVCCVRGTPQLAALNQKPPKVGISGEWMTQHASVSTSMGHAKGPPRDSPPSAHP